MKIKKITKVKPRTVYAVTTSTGTFIADDLAHHNCFACNMYYGGNPAVFASKLIDEYGPEIITEFKQARHQVFKVDKTWYENKIKEYEEKLNEVVDN